MPKVMMPVDVEIWKEQYGSKPYRWALTTTYDSPKLDDGKADTEAEALAAAKEWILENGGTWEEEE